MKALIMAIVWALGLNTLAKISVIYRTVTHDRDDLFGLLGHWWVMISWTLLCVLLYRCLVKITL